MVIQSDETGVDISGQLDEIFKRLNLINDRLNEYGVNSARVGMERLVRWVKKNTSWVDFWDIDTLTAHFYIALNNGEVLEARSWVNDIRDSVTTDYRLTTQGWDAVLTDDGDPF